jgi:superfamily II DNA or RNA helicase
MLDLLRAQRVLVEPASMELRFADEKIEPRLELELVGDDNVRVKVGFFQENSSRRFSLNNGAWFEGTPCYHIDTTEGIVRELEEHVSPSWLQRIFRSPYIISDMVSLPRLIAEDIPKVAASLQARLPDLASVAEVTDHTPQFALRVDGDMVDARARIFATYGEHEFSVPSVGMAAPLQFFPPGANGGAAQVVRREIGTEMVAVQSLLSQGFLPSDSGEELVAAGEQAIAFWTEGLGELPEEWDRFIPDDLVGVTVREEGVSPRMRVSSGVDWLGLDLTFDSGGVAVDEIELRSCLAEGRRLVKLADGTYAPVDPNDVAEVLARMAEIYASAGQEKKLPLSQAGRLQDLMKIVDGSHATPKTEQLFTKMGDLGSMKLIAKPRQLKATLRPYQKSGFSWLVFLHNASTGGILADDMGLGKTVQTIALLVWAGSPSRRKQDGEKKVSLVVAPTSVVPNWERELSKFAPHLKTVVWQGANRHAKRAELDDADVIITSYALIRRDEDMLAELNLGYAILDEAQHIKNPLSHTAQAVKRLKSTRRLALTGTPIENRLSEIWSIFDFVSPGLLGRLKPFEEQYARPIERGDEETMNRLRATIQPFVLRRTKSEVAKDLPAKIEQEIVVPLTEEQQKLYKQILREVRKSVLSEVDNQGVNRSQIQILAALTRLRQVACDPRLLNIERDKWTAAESGKLGALREILRNSIEGGHRVLVFSQFVTMLGFVRDLLDEEGVRYEYLDGSSKNRMDKVDAFNSNPDISAFLISLKAGGTGLNLVGADTVIHFDPWWNPAVEDQATDRAHRIGQTRTVNVYRLIAASTVEEKILSLSAKKRALMTNVLSSEGSPLKGLTRDDVDDLFSE